MYLQQQPDGSWATTPVYVGESPVPAKCDKHDWTDAGAKEPAAEEFDGMTHIQLQVCATCGWKRTHLTKEG